jgi:hypothetical protein
VFGSVWRNVTFPSVGLVGLWLFGVLRAPEEEEEYIWYLDSLSGSAEGVIRNKGGREG